MSGKPERKHTTFALGGSVVVLISLLLFFLDYYKVYSSSMLPGLHPGDHIIVERLTYDRRPTEHDGSRAIAFITFGCVKKGDIIVFNKPLWQFSPVNPQFYGEEYVKRCYGAPGDSISIDKPPLHREYAPRFKEPAGMDIFTHDSSFKWSSNKLGPLWVPRKGESIILDDYNLKLYRSILQLEDYPLPSDRKAFLHKEKKERTYTFKYDYYFFLGDNFYESEDSRRWGFVPRFNLIGKVLLKI